MSATNKIARREAVCGAKPGGASAYHLKESCALKTTVPDKGYYTKKVLGSHATTMKRLLDAVEAKIAEIRAEFGSKTVSAKTPPVVIEQLSDFVIALFVGKRHKTYKKCVMEGFKTYNEHVLRYNQAHANEQLPSAVAGIHLFYAVSNRISCIAKGSITAAKAGKAASH